MLIKWADFNGAEEVSGHEAHDQWREICALIEGMPLHLKASDQAGLQGQPIFDPVGTNNFLKKGLERFGWNSNIPIPANFRFLGTDVDFGKLGVLVEVQFSNYPFLLNNILRSELFFKSQVNVAGRELNILVIITKARMFKASNSTLYYEQAVSQVDALAQHNVFDVPVRIVGLFETSAPDVAVIWTEYENPRYSRTVITRWERHCRIENGRGTNSRSSIMLI